MTLCRLFSNREEGVGGTGEGRYYDHRAALQLATYYVSRASNGRGVAHRSAAELDDDHALAESARRGQQLRVQHGASRGAANGVVSQRHHPQIEHRV